MVRRVLTEAKATWACGMPQVFFALSRILMNVPNIRRARSRVWVESVLAIVGAVRGGVRCRYGGQVAGKPEPVQG